MKGEKDFLYSVKYITTNKECFEHIMNVLKHEEVAKVSDLANEPNKDNLYRHQIELKTLQTLQNNLNYYFEFPEKI